MSASAILYEADSKRTRAKRVMREALRVEDAAVRDQMKLLENMRRQVLGAMVSEERGTFRRFHLSQVLREVDTAIARSRSASQGSILDATRSVYGLGSSMVQQVAGLRASLLQTQGAELLLAAMDSAADQVRGVWSDLGSRLKSAIRRTTLGITDPFEATKEVAKLVRSRRPFDNAEASAERIVRTEVNRTFGIGTFVRMEQANSAGVPVKKAWLTAGDNRVRDAHAQAGIDYDADHAIPNDEPFVVGGEELMYPLDPRGSAGNTINCRCRPLPVV